MSIKNWFDVNKEGLAQLLKRRGIQFALFELISNGFDTEAHSVQVEVTCVPGRPLAEVEVVDDDPQGFADLTHAFTLFAPSLKKNAPEKRGRFNLREKLVLAICEEAEIASTTGTIRFDAEGRHDHLRRKRPRGSVFRGRLRMTRDEVDQALAACRTILVPPGIELVVNGDVIPCRDPIASFEATLMTEIANDEGYLTRSRRKTQVRLYEPHKGDGEMPSVYELGFAVVETSDKFHMNIGQKVPLDMERGSVPPAFLRELRAHTLSAVVEHLKPEDAAASWVREAAGAPQVSDEAVRRVLDLRYGPDRVSADLSDREAENKAKAHNFTVVHGASLTAGEWENARRAGAIKPAGQVFPTPKPFHPNSKPLTLLDPEAYTIWHSRFDEFAKRTARLLIEKHITVEWVNDAGWVDVNDGNLFLGTYGNGLLRVNVAAFPSNAFENFLKDETASIELLDFLCHELAHEFAHNHLNAAYHDGLSRFGGILLLLAGQYAPMFTGK